MIKSQVSKLKASCSFLNILAFFNKNQPPNDVRVSLLEERLQTFDEISRQMLNKLEQAVDKISESNRNISQILIRHEERIDRSTEANGTMLQLIHKTESEIKTEIVNHEKSNAERFQNNEKQIEDLKRTRWLWAGIVMGFSFFLSQSKILDRVLHPGYHQEAPLYGRKAN
jgi:Mg2+ and Co2+ transporter CorA